MYNSIFLHLSSNRITQNYI